MQYFLFQKQSPCKMSTRLGSDTPSLLNSQSDFDGPSQNLWQLLRQACEDCEQQLAAFMTDNDGVYSSEEILTPSFIKSRLSI
jgi:hypothetical protein